MVKVEGNHAHIKFGCCNTISEAIIGKWDWTRCYNCNPKYKSQGEIQIRSILKKLVNNKSIQEQKTFDWLVSKEHGKKMSLDFYFKKNGVEYAVEYQGAQHYMKVGDTWRNHVVTTDYIARDRRKRLMCNYRNIVYIAVPYFIKDIESFIKKRIYKHRS